MKPTCAEMTELATDYLEGRTRLTTAAMIRLHLMLCEHCWRYYAQVETVRAAATSAAEDPSPENIEALQARFREWKAKREES